MNWELVAALAEAVGALAVVVSVIYLAQQVRQSNEVARATYHIAQSTNYRNLQRSVLENSEVESIFRRGLLDPTALEVGEYHRFMTLMGEYFQHLEAQAAGARAGLVGEDIANSWASLVASWLAMPGGREAWDVMAGFFPQDVHELLEVAGREALPTDKLFPRAFHARSD